MRVVARVGLFLFAFFYEGQAQKLCPVDKAFLRSAASIPLSIQRLNSSGDTLWVPLAIHIVERQPGEFPLHRIGAQLRALNRDFAPAKIQFYLPRYGPNGEPTCGVTRSVSPLASHDWSTQEDSLKNLISWNPDSFLNVWIVSSMSMQVIGYARALGDTESKPGVVLAMEVVGDGEGVRHPYDRGRTAVHEIGHVFSLLHPFEGGCRGMTPQTCATEGDEICDTPPQRQAYYGCPNPAPNTCNETPIDLPDPVYNYMGYADDSCMNYFTPEQIARMRTFLQNRGAVLISIENQQARGRLEPMNPSCAAITTLAASQGQEVSFARKGSTIIVKNAAHILIYDAAGRLVHQTQGEVVSLEGLPPGLYYLHAVVEGRLFTHKVPYF